MSSAKKDRAITSFPWRSFKLTNKVRSFYISALAVIGVGLLGLAFAPKARASAWDKMTVVTVNGPIIAGNKVLSPGTYVWKLMDSPSNRHIVQIFDKDQRKLEETILAIPNYRLQPTGQTEFAFWEIPAGVPRAVRAWFYPGDNFGQEFAYPKKLIAELTSATPVPVPNNYREPEPSPAPEAIPAPAPQPISALEMRATETETVTLTAMQETKSLPHTASLNPLIGLIGIVALGVAGLLSFVTSRA